MKAGGALDKPLLQVHRGVSTDYPENTASAFVGTLYQGYKIIELGEAIFFPEAAKNTALKIYVILKTGLFANAK